MHRCELKIALCAYTQKSSHSYVETLAFGGETKLLPEFGYLGTYSEKTAARDLLVKISATGTWVPTGFQLAAELGTYPPLRRNSIGPPLLH